jgi:hypothetical protein
MRAPITTAVAIAIGLIVLLGYFLPAPPLQTIRIILLGWAGTLAGVLLLIGVFNLIGVHWRRFTRSKPADYYSPYLIATFLITLVAGLWLGPGSSQFQRVVSAIQVPIETSLLAILAISLSVASLSLLKSRKNLMMIVFTFSVALFLLVGSGFLTGLSESIPLFGSLLAALNRLPLAGIRGILLGIALGSLVTGLRILLGVDRPYSG